jgi:hypothetical protein
LKRSKAWYEVCIEHASLRQRVDASLKR